MIGKKAVVIKKMFPFLILVVLVGCSDDTEENAPQLSFEIEEGPKFASVEINVTNTSSNYNGDYLWEVTSPSGATSSTTTKDIRFNAPLSGQYFIKLSGDSGELDTRQDLFIVSPAKQVLNKISLREIPKNYEGLYFKIKRYNSFEDTTSMAYTSETKEGVTTENASQIVWNIENNPFTFSLLEASFQNLASYEIEFFNENDELVTRFDPFFNGVFEVREFIAGELTMTTTSSDCADCDIFEIVVDVNFTN